MWCSPTRDRATGDSRRAPRITAAGRAAVAHDVWILPCDGSRAPDGCHDQAPDQVGPRVEDEAPDLKVGPTREATSRASDSLVAGPTFGRARWARRPTRPAILPGLPPGLPPGPPVAAWSAAEADRRNRLAAGPGGMPDAASRDAAPRWRVPAACPDAAPSAGPGAERSAGTVPGSCSGLPVARLTGPVTPGDPARTRPSSGVDVVLRHRRHRPVGERAALAVTAGARLVANEDPVA